VSAVPSPAQAKPAAPTIAGTSFHTTTDRLGAFALRVDPGTYDLELTPPEGSPYPRWSWDGVTVLEDTHGLELVLPEGVPIPVEVEADGTAVAGAAVRILVLDEVKGRPPRERALATTDEVGQASVLLPNPRP
jgi:hypothetical protein